MKLSVAIWILAAYFLGICSQHGSHGSGKGGGNTGSGLTWPKSWSSSSEPSAAMKECAKGTPPNEDNCKSGGPDIKPEQKSRWYGVAKATCKSYKDHDSKHCASAKDPKKDFASKEECEKHCQ